MNLNRSADITVILALAVLLGACTDRSPTEPGTSGDERSGTLHAPEGWSAIVLEVEPAHAAPGLRIGPPAGQPGAYLVRAAPTGRVLVLAEEVLAPRSRLRVSTDAADLPVVVRIVSAARADGAVSGGGDLRIAWD